MLSSVEHEKSFITLGPDQGVLCLHMYFIPCIYGKGDNCTSLYWSFQSRERMRIVYALYSKGDNSIIFWHEKCRSLANFQRHANTMQALNSL